MADDKPWERATAVVAGNIERPDDGLLIMVDPRTVIGLTIGRS